MESVSIENSGLSLTTFIFTFVQRVFRAYYDWFLDQLDYLVKNWFDFSLKKPTKFSVNLDPLTRQYLEVTVKPKHVTVIVEDKDSEKQPLTLGKSPENQEDLEKNSVEAGHDADQKSIFHNLEEIVRMKQEFDMENEGNLKQGNNSQNVHSFTSKYPRVNKKPSRRNTHSLSLMPGTHAKLNDYNQRNHDYLYNKLTDGSSVDGYCFTHPDGQAIFSRRPLLMKTPLPKHLKQRSKTFKPTELSIIFETLAY